MFKSKLFIALLFVFGAGGWYAFRPERLFVNARVNARVNATVTGFRLGKVGLRPASVAPLTRGPRSP